MLRSFATPPTRHFERSKPTLFPAGSLLRTGRLVQREISLLPFLVSAFHFLVFLLRDAMARDQGRQAASAGRHLRIVVGWLGAGQEPHPETCRDAAYNF